jgi:hypothetical protein
VVGSSALGSSVEGSCVLGTLVVGTCVLGTLVVGTCVLGTLVVGTCVLGTLVAGAAVDGKAVVPCWHGAEAAAAFQTQVAGAGLKTAGVPVQTLVAALSVVPVGQLLKAHTTA